MSENRSSRPKGQNDPGWNDPPKLEFSTIQPNKSTRLNLNKRVAFPLQGTAAAAASSTSKPTAIVHPSHPPMTMPPVAIVPPMARMVPPFNPSATEDASNGESRLEPEQDSTNLADSERQLCLDTFLGCASQIPEEINIRSDEVQRRINLMNQMWLSGTLAPSVQRKLQIIAKALIESNFNEAIETHRTLVVNHSNFCAAWGAALRQIILTIQPSGGDEVAVAAEHADGPDGNTAAVVPERDHILPTELESSAEDNANRVQHI